MNILRAAFTATLGLTIVIGAFVILWLSVTTANFLVVISYTYDPATQTFELQRRVDYPADLSALWNTEAYGNGLECHEEGESTYEKIEKDPNGAPVVGPDGSIAERLVVRWKASSELIPCLTDPNFSVVTRWSARIWGPIILRPIYRYIPPRE